MKIIEEPIVDYEIATKIIAAKLIADYKIEITFNDGEKKVVNFEHFLSSSQHPSIRKYLDKNKFMEFEIKNGNLNWNDYDLIFPLSDLKKGQIS
jgi:uncharacterized protein YjbK